MAEFQAHAQTLMNVLLSLLVLTRLKLICYKLSFNAKVVTVYFILIVSSYNCMTLF